MPDDRRKEPRCLIDVPLFCSLQNQSGNTVICIINDISLNGAMLIVAPADQELLPVGQYVTFVEVPNQFGTMLANMQATVAWRKDKVCGLKFRHSLPLTEDGLIAIVTSIENTMGMGLTLFDEDELSADFNDDERF